MNQKIIILDADKKQAQELRVLLQSHSYHATKLFSLSKLETCINQHDCKAVFIDIDTVHVDNRKIRDLTQKYPKLFFFCISKKKFNPELKDAICYHIYACISRPIDPDEILYFLKCVDSESQTV